MKRIWRQNPLLRIIVPLLMGLTLCPDYRGTLLHLTIGLILLIIYFIDKKIVWISASLFFMLIATGSTWNALVPPTEINTLCPTDWEQKQSRKQNALAQELNEKLKAHYSEADIGVIIAFLVGDTSYIGSEIKSQYKTIGISHILAVSGMHIGLLFSLLYGILNFVTLQRTPKLSQLLSLTGIWIFCYICQFPPSLNRAAIMFSFLHLGKLFLKKSNALNLLSLSLLVQICWSPEEKDDWGLILSHLAVAGIVFFHRPVQLKINDWKKAPKLILENILITIHAQWSTGIFLMPLTLQFPTYFLVSNFLLVPISTGLLYGLLIVIAFPPLWNLSWVHSLIHDWIWGMNEIVHKLCQWPHPQVLFHQWTWALESIWILIGLMAYYSWQNQWAKVKGLFALLILMVHFDYTFSDCTAQAEIHLWRHHGQPCMLYLNSTSNQYMGPVLNHPFLPKELIPLRIED